MVTHWIIKSIKKLWYNKNVFAPRVRYARRDIVKKISRINVLPINDEQRTKITKFWNNYKIDLKLDFRWFDYFNTINPNCTNIEYFIPHDIFYGLIDTNLSDPIKAKYFDDKNLYDLIFHDIPQPKTVIRKENGIILDENYNIINIEAAIKKCTIANRVIIKPSVESEGGTGIKFWDATSNSISELKDILTKDGRYIISEIAKQSPTLSQIHKDSLNTVRIISLLNKGEVIILSSVLRMGVNGNKVDNCASGGIFCGINDDGRLKEVAYNSLGEIFTHHPQGGELSNYIIPNLHKCKNLVKICAPRLQSISKLCSWDIYIDENDNPALIEVNMSYGDVQLHQLTNGPIFGSLTPDVLSSIFDKK